MIHICVIYHGYESADFFLFFFSLGEFADFFFGGEFSVLNGFIIAW